MKRRRTVTRCRVNRELRLVVRLLQVRDRISDVFWRTFVLIIGTSVLVAVTFLATRHTPHTATAVGGAGAVAAVALTLVVFLPPDGSLNRRRLVLSQVAASIDYEHQNVCSQLDFLRQRRDTVEPRHPGQEHHGARPRALRVRCRCSGICSNSAAHPSN